MLISWSIQLNGCGYCLSAHSYLGKNLAKLSEAEIAANRHGGSLDPKADAAVRFAAKIGFDIEPGTRRRDGRHRRRHRTPGR